jgi:hypothetical protein
MWASREHVVGARDSREPAVTTAEPESHIPEQPRRRSIVTQEKRSKFGAKTDRQITEDDQSDIRPRSNKPLKLLTANPSGSCAGYHFYPCRGPDNCQRHSSFVRRRVVRAQVDGSLKLLVARSITRNTIFSSAYFPAAP